MEGSMPPHHESGQVSDYINQEIMPEVTLCDFHGWVRKSFAASSWFCRETHCGGSQLSSEKSDCFDATMPVRHREGFCLTAVHKLPVNSQHQLLMM